MNRLKNSEESTVENLTETFDNLDQLLDQVKIYQDDAQATLNKYRSFIRTSIGPFPKTELELVAFIRRVVGYLK